MTGNKNEWPANIFVEVMKSKTKQFFHNLFHCRKERMKALKKCQRLVWNILAMNFKLRGNINTAAPHPNTTAKQL